MNKKLLLLLFALLMTAMLLAVPGVNNNTRDITTFPYVEGFNTAVPPTDWTSTVVLSTGTVGHLTMATAGTHPVCTPYEGTGMAAFDSYTCSSTNEIRLATPRVNFAGVANPALSFYMMHDVNYPTLVDYIQIQVSTNGTDWTQVGDNINRYDAAYTTAAWALHTVDLAAYANQSIYVGILFHSGYGNDIYLDQFNLYNDVRGIIAGTVTSGATPLADVEVSVTDGTNTQTATTSATGTYTIPSLALGTYTATFTKTGYTTQTVNNIAVTANNTTTVNANMPAMTMFNVTGHVVGSDVPTVGLADCAITLTGYANYTANTNASGDFTITGVFSGYTYAIAINHDGYTAYTNSNVAVSGSNVSLGTITLAERANAPRNVVAVANTADTQVDVTWEAPGDVQGLESFDDGFESGNFDNFTFIQGNGTAGDNDQNWWYVLTGDANYSYDGESVAKIDWGYDIDTALITPAVAVQNGYVMNFWWEGSYTWSIDPNPNATFTVEVSSDGEQWTSIWDFNNIGVWEDWTWYETNVDLSSYAGQSLMFKFHFVGNDNADQAMDLIHIGPATTRQFGTFARSNAAGNTPSLARSANGKEVLFSSSKAHGSQIANRPNLSHVSQIHNTRTSRSLMGYKVSRLVLGQETNPANWTTIVANTTNLTASDAGWATVATGTYKYAVQAIYTNNVLSNATFSSIVEKNMYAPVTVNVSTNDGATAAGATVNLTSTDAAHTYSVNVPASQTASFAAVYRTSYVMTVSKSGYNIYTQNITIGQTNTFDVVIEETTSLPVAPQVTCIPGNTTQANLAWHSADEVPVETLVLDDGTNGDSIGLNGGGTFIYAVRFTAADLAEYAGCVLSKVTAYFNDIASPTTIKVYTGGTSTTDAGTEVYSEEVTGLTAASWNEIQLSSPITITGSEELWIGFEVTHASGAHPAGCSTTSYVADQGDMIALDGAWDTLYNATEGSYSYAWNIHGWTVGANGRDVEINRSLTGYKVYLNGQLQGQVGTDARNYLLSGLVSGQTYTAGVTAVYTSGETQAATVQFTFNPTAANDNNVAPARTELVGNYPNPFNPNTTIKFANKENGMVKLNIFNVRGQKVRSLVNSQMAAGTHTINWNGTDDNGNVVASGVYMYNLECGRYTSTKKMILMK